MYMYSKILMDNGYNQVEWTMDLNGNMYAYTRICLSKMLEIERCRTWN